MTDTEVVIRKASELDINRLADLLIELFSIETDFTIDREKHIKGISLVLNDSTRSVMLVAEYKGSIVGMVSGQLVISTAEGGLSVLLEDMCVTASCRRLQIGTSLVDALLNWGREKGASRVQLVADSENLPALEFYAKKKFSKSRMIGFYRNIRI